MNNIYLCVYLSIDWLSLGTLFVTFITAFTALLTVRQVKKQHESSYFPELYLADKHIQIFGEEWKDTFLPFKYISEETNVHEISNAINLDVFNVGLAVAKTVEYKWSFDLNGIIDLIQKSNKSGFFHIYSKNILNISIPQKEYSQRHIITNQLRKQSVNYILQASIDKSPTQIMLPESYLDLFMIFACIKLEIFEEEKHKNKPIRTFNFDSDNFPPLKIDFSYKDLHGKDHIKKFSIIPNLYTLTAAKNISKEKNKFGNFSLEVIEL